LGKGHTQKLIEAREPADAIVATVFADTTVELAFGQEGHQLSEQKLPGVHRQVPSKNFPGKDYQNSAGQVEIDTGEKSS
jgi:hypothetical protein